MTAAVVEGVVDDAWFAAVMLVVGGVLVVVAAHQRRRAGRLESLGVNVAVNVGANATTVTEGAGERTGARSGDGVRSALEARIGAKLRSVASGVAVGSIERDLLLAGVSGRVRPDEVLGAQVLAALAGAGVAALLIAVGMWDGQLAIAAFVVLVIAGATAPRTMLRRRAQRRQAQLHARVSDALDLLTLCVEAGLAFDAALVAVAEAVPGPLGEELARVVSEMGLGLSRDEALENLRQRTESTALDSFVVALLQATALGTPVGRVLAGQADEARTRRRQESREKAGSLPVRILIPTVLLVFPPTFVILLGPAAVSIRGAF